MRRSVVVVAIIGFLLAAGASAASTVVVGSKNFPESRLLGEMFARLIEQRTSLTVERRFNLAGTQVCFEALKSGAIDLYPEYTGTGLVTLLGLEPQADVVGTRDLVRREFLARYDLRWLPPLGFENAYELAVPAGWARENGVETISDLVSRAGQLRAGFGYEFIDRRDGLVGLREIYGLRFAEVRGLQQALKYRAVAEGRIDCLDVYTTDGRLVVHDLAILRDDRSVFPPYEAAPLVRGETIDRHPELASTLALLAGALDESTMRRLNLRLQENGEPVELVAADALIELGLAETGTRPEAASRKTNWFGYMAAHRGELARRTLEHLALTGLALLLGVVVAIPLGLILERRRSIAETVIRIIGMTQTIPSIALLAFAIPLLGVGFVPALAALWLYSLFPILRNTYTGLRDASPSAVAAGEALGMTAGQVLRWIRLPLAAPIVLAGIRTSAVLTVGTATLAAFIGAGGLGEPIISGLQLADTQRILSGAVPAAGLAVAVDTLLAAVERRLTPAGLRRPSDMG